MNARITGERPIATSNPFGTATLRPADRDEDLVTSLMARVRAAVVRLRSFATTGSS
jgi:hypothetical protein